MLQLVYHGYVAGSAVARRLPEGLSYRAADVLGRWAARRSRKRAVVTKNLARVTGLSPGSRALDAVVDDAFRSYARYWLETFRLVREDADFFLDRFRSDSADNLDGVLARGKGAVVAVGHLGNWDAAGAWAAARGNRLVTVAEVLRPRRMFDFFADHRARLGMTIFPAEKGVTDRLVTAVEEGAVVAILGDRDLKGAGPPVRFFGESVPFPAGPASVALRSGVPLLVAGVYGVVRDGRRGWEAHISEPIELPAGAGPEAVPALTQRLATVLEGLVARRPEEWHVFQPFWPADRG